MEELGIKHRVTVGGEERPIKFGEVVRPTGEYEIRTYRFEDEYGQEADGYLFAIKPGGSTRVVKITDPEFTVEQIAVRGSGWLLALNPEGEMIRLEVGGDVKENPLVKMSKDWSYCWIANPSGNGLEVLNVDRPPFNPDVEIVLDFEDQRLPSNFWSSFNELKRQL